MTDRIPYVKMKVIFDNLLNQMLFSDEAKSFHGWEKNDFIVFLEDEIIACANEESYDIAIEAPELLQ